MNFQTEPVPGAVEKSLHAAFNLAGFVAFADKKFLDRLMDLRGGRLRAHQFECGLLAAQHGIVKLADWFAGTTFDHRAGDVAEIAGSLRTREHVENDWFVGPQR